MADGILSDLSIRTAVERGDIEIDPFRPEQLNPASYDLTLGEEVVVYRRWVAFDEQWASRDHGPRDGSDVYPYQSELDIRKQPEIIRWNIDPKKGWLVRPGIGYLMHTAERVHTKKFVPVLDGKSSVGRLFVQVHVTAGYGDPGFNGQYTLEVLTNNPVRVFPGMRIAQIRFHTLAGDLEHAYEGNYTGESAKGAVPSKCWKQFQQKL